MPVAFAIGISGFLFFLQNPNLPITIPIQLSISQTQNFALLAVPMFILMAYLSSSSGLAKDLYTAAANWLSNMKGGLAIATVFACGIFGAMSGASVAAAAAMSNIAITNMRRFGYSDELAAGSVGAAMIGSDSFNYPDGTIDGQVDSQDKLLPMIPQQFLVVRNVKISTTDWGADGAVLSSNYGSGQGSTHSDSSSTSGSGGVSLGFISFGGTASHSEENASGQGSSFQARSADSYFGTTFDGQTLHIPGAQIVAFLSDIVPGTPAGPCGPAGPWSSFSVSRRSVMRALAGR